VANAARGMRALGSASSHLLRTESGVVRIAQKLDMVFDSTNRSYYDDGGGLYMIYVF